MHHPLPLAISTDWCSTYPGTDSSSFFLFTILNLRRFVSSFHFESTDRFVHRKMERARLSSRHRAPGCRLSESASDACYCPRSEDNGGSV
uniref:Uncharacterized protein n=1 Tax=Kalanchoe fedtschenkoi TaxID=63787 RepID=A0A7N0RF27_KALFE